MWTSMKTNLSKHTCCFSDFRWPEDAPTFPSCAQVRQYLEDYAVHFDLVRYVRFGQEVTAVAPSKSGGWEVTFVPTPADGDGNDKTQKTTEMFDKCIIASGIFVTPYFPPPEQVRGITEAVETGWVTHSGEYRDPEPFSGKSVLVVGCAFSGAEIASGLTEKVEKCVVATGGASVFLPRVFSMPVPSPDKQPAALADVPSVSAEAEVENETSSTPSASLTAGGADVNAGGASSASPDEKGLDISATAESRTGGCGDSCGDASGADTSCPESTTYGMPLDLALYSLKAAAGEKAKNLSAAEKLQGLRAYCLILAGQDPGDVHEALRLESGPNAATSVAISESFLRKVRDGSIDVRPRLIALDVQERKAHFSDGTSEHVDHVICCTGLRSKIGFLPANILEQYEFEESDSVQPILLHALTWNPCVPSLGFVGMYRAPYFGVVELQARWVARMWSGAVPPPTAEACTADLQERRDVRNAQPRSQFGSGYLEIMETLAEVAGLVPAQDWSVHAGGDSPFIQQAAESTNVREGGVDLNGSLPALPEAGIQTSTARDDRHGPDNDIKADGVDANNAPKTQHSVELSSFSEALAEICPNGQKEKGMLVLKEWLWSGPLLPCHYRIREFLAHGTAMGLGDAVREIQHVNTKYPGYVKV